MDKDNAGVIAPPPLIVAASIVAGLLLDRVLPLPVAAGIVIPTVGKAVVALSFVLFGLAVREFRRHNTAINPRRATSAIISRGPYRLSRNPVYLAMVMAHTGAALWANSLWLLGTLAVTMVILTKEVIEREEAYLERKFGQEYLDYKGGVRRWL